MADLFSTPVELVHGACVALWLGAPAFTAWVTHQRRQRRETLERLCVRAAPVALSGAPYRADHGQARPVVRPSRLLMDLEQALAGAGLAVSTRRHGWSRAAQLVIDGGGPVPAVIITVDDPGAVSVDDLCVEASEIGEALAALRALVPVLGPLEVTVEGRTRRIDGTRHELG